MKQSWLKSWGVACMFLLPGTVLAQTPTIALSGLPTQPLISEEFCVDINFTNAAVTTGYGPYVVVNGGPFLTLTSLTFVDISSSIQDIGTFDATLTLDNPITGDPITGVEGARAWLTRYPVGSVDNGAAPLVLTACGVVEPGAALNVPIDVSFSPGFEYGDTATGANGPIEEAAVASTVTPVVARIVKYNTTPERERPPGPSFPFNYVWAMNASNQELVQNLVLTDNLPADIQWTGGAITITAPTGNGCAVTTLPNEFPVPSGTVEVQCTDLLGTTSEEDLRVTVPVYISDILDGTAGNDRETIVNTVDFDYDNRGVTYNDSDPSQVVAEHVSVQKAVDGEVLPNQILTYRVNFQVTDYAGGASALVITDILPDGLLFEGTVSLTVNGDSVPITPVVAGPVAGVTTIDWDVAAAVGGAIPAGSRGRLVYEARVREFYATGQPVRSADPLVNNADITFTLGEGGQGSDGTSIPAEIRPNVTDKRIVAPNPLPGQLSPGQLVTFELFMDIPGGSSRSVVFTDFLPRPVFDVADFDTVNGWRVITSGLNPPTPTVTTNTNSNAIIFDWGNIASIAEEQLTLQFDIVVSDDPFADDLFLTNLLSTSYVNTDGETIANLDAVEIVVGAPQLIMTKGIIAADNPNAVFDVTPPANPAQALADSNVQGVDGNDVLTYVLTVENIGGQPAYEVTVTDPDIAGLSCAQPTAAQVVNGSGAQLAFSGNIQTGLVLTQPLPANDNNPAGGGAPFSDDTALITLTCTIAPSAVFGSSLTNTAAVTWKPTAGAQDAFPPIEDEAIAVIALPEIEKIITGITPNKQTQDNHVVIGEMVSYQVRVRVPEGSSPDSQLVDTLNKGLAFEFDNPGSAPPWGVPSPITIVAAGSITTDVVGGFATIADANTAFFNVGNSPEGEYRRVIFGPGNSDFGFGTITNDDDNNATDEYITLDYQTRVLNFAENVQGKKLRNNVSWSWQPDGGIARVEITGTAPNILVDEPVLKVTKRFSENLGDQNSTPTVTIVIENDAATSKAVAYDVTLTDVLPDNMEYSPLSSTLNCVGVAQPDETFTGNLIYEADFESLDIGASCSIELAVVFTGPVSAGESYENCADLRWESLSDFNDGLIGPQPPHNSLGFERTGTNVDPGGSANDYAAIDCDTFNIFDVGVEKTVIATDQSHTDGLSAPAETEPLTIGEQVTFRIVTTLPEAQVTQFQILDSLPSSAVVLRYDAVQNIAWGADITVANGAPTITVLDRDGDGLEGTVVLDFGDNVTQLLNGTTDIHDTISFEVLATIVDIPRNQDGDLSANIAQAQFGPQASGTPTIVTDQWKVTIVEPALDLTKTGSTDSLEAGGAVEFTLRVEHLPNSEADAFNLYLTDVIPTELSYVPGTVRTGDVCTQLPNLLSPEVVAGEVRSRWDVFPLGAVCEIKFDTVANVSAISGDTITNTADLEWTSLDTVGDPDDRFYSASSKWAIVVSQPGIEKVLVSTSVPASGFRAEDPDQALTIGEAATFNIIVTFPDGTAENVFIEDNLPTGTVSLDFLSGEIIAIGKDLTVDPGIVVGLAIGDCEIPAANCQGWNIGTVLNKVDFRPDPDQEDQMVFEVVAIVNDDPLNSGALGSDKDVANSSEARSNEVRLTDIAQFDLIEPILIVDKVNSNGKKDKQTTAGAIEKFIINVRHADASTTTALEVLVTDTLDPVMTYQGLDDAASTCPGLIAPVPVDPPELLLTFEIPEFSLFPGDCLIVFDVQISNAVVLGESYTNTVDIQWETAPGSPENRTSVAPPSEANLFLLNELAVTKRISATTVDDTGVGAFDPDDPPGYPGNVIDATLGEAVEFEVTVTFDEGTTTNAVITDTVDPGWTILFADVIFVGKDITTELPGTPVINGNSISSEFGDVLNAGDGQIDENDTIVFRGFARVQNTNTQGTYLENTASITADNAAEQTDFDVVDVVQPLLEVDKTFDSLIAAVATITLQAENTGSAAAYDFTLTDDFNESEWLPGSLVPVTVPGGYELVESVPVAGVFTVTLQKIAGKLQGPTLFPGDTLATTFTMTLANDGVVTTPSILNTATGQGISTPIQNPDSSEPSDIGEDTLLFPQYELEKTWSGANNPALPGDVITYILTLENTGLAPATNVVITDTPDAIGTFLVGSVTTDLGTVVLGNSPGNTTVEVNVPSLPVGTVTVSYQVQIPLPYPDGTVQPEELVNQASATSTELLPILSDDPATADVDDETIVPIAADPVMSITKDDGVLLTVPGALLSYEVLVQNTGNQNATGVEVTETVPQYTSFVAAASTPGWSCADGSRTPTVCTFIVDKLTARETRTLVFAVQVDSGVPVGVDQIVNDIVVTDDGVEFDPADPVIPSTDTDNEITPLIASPQLAISKDDGGISVVPGQAYSYTINYGNTGNQDATGVVLTETVPDFTTYNANRSGGTPWNCSAVIPGSVCTLDIGFLPAGASGSVLFGLTVDSPAESGVDAIFNSALIENDGVGGNLSETDDDVTPVIAAPDLVVEKVSETDIIYEEGDVVVYTVSYSNQGTQDSVGVVLTETVPAATVFYAPDSDPAWSCSDGDPAGTQCTINIGSLPVDAGGSYDFAVTTLKIPDSRQIANVVTIEDNGSNGGDLDVGNNTSRLIIAYLPRSIPVLDRRYLALLILGLVLLAWAGRFRGAASGASRR
jgi:large repetitive protein